MLAYVPYTVVQHIRAGRDPHHLPPARVEVNMMAADIVCFTSLSEGCPLTEVCHTPGIYTQVLLLRCGKSVQRSLTCARPRFGRPEGRSSS